MRPRTASTELPHLPRLLDDDQAHDQDDEERRGGREKPV
jgi:hypothetical protein